MRQDFSSLPACRKETRMPDNSLDLESYVDPLAALIGLPIDPEHRPGSFANLERIAQMAALVMEFPLGDGDEPAPVFRP